MSRLFFLLALVTCASCLDPTQIRVTIDTSYKCEDFRTNMAMWIGDESGSTGTLDKVTATKACTTGSVIGDIVVVPRKSVNDTVFVRVLAGINGTDPIACSLPQGDAGPDGGSSNLQCIEAKRILRFVNHSKLEVSITLDSACINVRCPNPTDTCKNGVCVDAHEDPGDAGMIVDSGRDAEPVFKPAADLFGSFDDVCATAKGGPYCWGDNKTGELGPNGGTTAGGPTQIPMLPQSIQSMAIGGGHICATDGAQVFCWGLGSSGELGRVVISGNGIDPKPTPVPTLGMTNTALVAGGKFACVLSAKSATCWGTVVPQLVTYPMPTLIPSVTFNALSAGAQHICGRTTAKVACWGDNSKAQLNTSPSLGFSVMPISFGTGVTWISAGFDHNAIDNDTTNVSPCPVLGCNLGWGSNSAGELGGTMDPQFPIQRLGTNASQIAMGAGHICLIDMTSGVHCRGRNNDGQLGGSLDMTGFSNVSLPGVTKIVAGRTFSCALDGGGHVWCWGTIPGVMTKQMTPIEVLLP